MNVSFSKVNFVKPSSFLFPVQYVPLPEATIITPGLCSMIESLYRPSISQTLRFQVSSKAKFSIPCLTLSHNCLDSIDISRIALIHSFIYSCVIGKYDYFKLSYYTIIIEEQQVFLRNCNPIFNCFILAFSVIQKIETKL